MAKIMPPPTDRRFALAGVGGLTASIVYAAVHTLISIFNAFTCISDAGIPCAVTGNYSWTGSSTLLSLASIASISVFGVSGYRLLKTTRSDKRIFMLVLSAIAGAVCLYLIPTTLRFI